MQTKFSMGFRALAREDQRERAAKLREGVCFYCFCVSLRKLWMMSLSLSLSLSLDCVFIFFLSLSKEKAATKAFSFIFWLIISYPNQTFQCH